MALSRKLRALHGGLLACSMLAAGSLAGCQSYYAGQTLPSPFYLTDDVSYHAPAPREMKLSQEAAAMQAAAAEQVPAGP